MLLTDAVTVGTTVLLKTAVVVAAVAPFGAVTVTEYNPSVLTTILDVVSPVLQR
ncbi:hypothetical protein GCM10027577_41030 [Spirosoma fluminis]